MRHFGFYRLTFIEVTPTGLRSGALHPLPKTNFKTSIGVLYLREA